MTATVPVTCPKCKGTGIDPDTILMTRCRVCEPYIPDRRRRQMSATTELERKAKSVKKDLSISVADRFQNRKGTIYMVTNIVTDKTDNPQAVNTLDDMITLCTEGVADKNITLCRDDIHQMLEFSWERLPNGLVMTPRQTLIGLNNRLLDAWRLAVGSGVQPDSLQAGTIIAAVRDDIDKMLYPDS